CPHCGVKKPVTQTSGWAWLVVILFVLVILGKGIGGRDAGSGTPTPESPPPRRAISANPPASAAPPSSSPACDPPRDGDRWARVRSSLAHVYYPNQAEQIGSLDNLDVIRVGASLDSVWVHVAAPVVASESPEKESYLYVMRRAELCRMAEVPTLDSAAYEPGSVRILPRDLDRATIIILDPGNVSEKTEETVTYRDMLGNPTRPIRFIAEKWFTTRGMARQDLVGWYDWIAVAILMDGTNGPPGVVKGEPMLIRQGRRGAARRLLLVEPPSVADAPPVIVYAGSTSNGVDVLAIEPSGEGRESARGSWVKAKCGSNGLESAERSEANADVRKILDRSE